MRLPDFLIRDDDMKTFRWWISNAKRSGDEMRQTALELENTVPLVFAMFYPELTIRDINGMTFKDVKIRLVLINKRLESQKDLMGNMSPPETTYNYIRNVDLEAHR